MSFNEVAVCAEELSKCYHVYDTPRDRLLQSFWRGKRKLYKEFWAVRDVSFEVYKGEVVGIIGRNGSGKSTLLQLLAGTLSSSSGQITANGRITALLELGAGFNPEFTGRENVYLSGAVMGMSLGEIESKFASIVRFADIGSFIDQPVKTYSSGMYVRLAFAIMANIDPDIFLVDEALAVGDAYFVHKCMLRFNQMRERGTTILLVTHDPTAVKTLCDRAVWIENGRVEKIGRAGRVVDEYLSAIRNQPVVSNFSEAKSKDRSALPAGALSSSTLAPESSIPNIDRRLGSQSCSFTGVAIYDECLRKLEIVPNDSEVILRVTFVNNDLPELHPIMLGYSLRNARGVDIASSNSEIEKVEISAPKIGQAMSVRMKTRLPRLHPGSYSFNISLGHRNAEGKMESLDGMANGLVIEVISDLKVHVLMSLRTEYEVE